MKAFILKCLKNAGLTDVLFKDVVRPYYKKDDNGKPVIEDGKLVTAGFMISWQHSHLFAVADLQKAIEDSNVGYYAKPFKDASRSVIEYNTWKAELLANGEECPFEFSAPIGISKSLEYTESAEDVFK